MANNPPIQRRRIIFWGPLFEKVGTEKSQKNTSEALRELGYHTIFLSVFGEYKNDKSFTEVIRSPFILTKILIQIKPILGSRISNFIAQLYCAILILFKCNPFRESYILHTSLSGLLPLLVIRLIGGKSISSIQGLPSFIYVSNSSSVWRRVEAALRKFLWKIVYRKHIVYTISSETKERLILLGLEKVHFIPNYVEVKSASSNCGRDDNGLCVVGRLTYQKNLELLTFLIRGLSDKNWDIIGDCSDAYGEQFLSSIQHLPNVRYHGHVSEPFDRTNAKHLIFLSRWDEAALTPIEAKKSGLNVLYSEFCFGMNDFIIGSDYLVDVKKEPNFVLNEVQMILAKAPVQNYVDIYTFENHKIMIGQLFNEIN